MSAATERFTCACCGGKFVCKPGYTDEDRRAEYERNFGEPMDENGVSPVCDDCYRDIVEWARARGLVR